MKAIRIHAYGPPDRLMYEDVPDPAPGPGEVVVQVEAAGVNPADYKFRNGMLAAGNPKPPPFTPGMDIAGRVTQLGPGVEGLAIGDRVLAMLHLMGNGGYAEQVAVPADWCAAMPAGLDPAVAATLPTPGTTAVVWVEDDLEAASGRRVLVTGAAGAVGRIASHAARARGAHVTAALRRSQAALAPPADAVIFLDGGAAPAPGSYDAIADTVGGRTAEALLAALRPGGVLSTVATDPVRNHRADVETRFFGNRPDARRLARLAADVGEGRLSVPPPRKLPLSQARRAHELIERGGAGKIVLIPDSLA